MTDQVLTVKEVATIIRARPATVAEWCRKGKIKAFQPEGVKGWRIKRSDLDIFMSQREEGSTSVVS